MRKKSTSFAGFATIAALLLGFPGFAAAQAAADPAPEAQPLADAQAQAGTTPAQSEGLAQSEKPAQSVKKAVATHPLTVAASEAEATRLRAIGAVMHGWSLKVVSPPTIAGRQAAGVEAAGPVFAVRTSPGAATGSAGLRGVRVFTEQIHVVAGAGVERMEDLRGRVVSFGPAGAPAQDVARAAFESLGIAVQATPLDWDNALDGLASGDVAAVVMVAPQPSARLRAIARSGLHLLAWPAGAVLPAGTVASTIPASAYPGLAPSAAPIRVCAVEAVLSVSARGAKLPAAQRFLDALVHHAPALTDRGLELLAADIDSRSRHRVANADKR